MKVQVIKIQKPILEADIENFRLFSKDTLWAYHPCVIKKSGKYYMFYTGKKIGKGIAHYACLATSSDLRSWKKEKCPIDFGKSDNDWDSDFIAHPFVFKDDNKYYMLYDGSKKGNWLEEIGLAESRNLLDWKKYQGNPIFKTGKSWWEMRHVSRCCIFKENGIFYMYYAGHDGERERIGLAIGESLITLKRFSEKPVLDVGCEGKWDAKSISDPKVIRYKGKYLMFYSGISNDGIERVGLAESKDLKIWKKFEKNPILDVSKGKWDMISAARADIKVFDDKVYLFYSGRKNYFYSIGIAKLLIK